MQCPEDQSTHVNKNGQKKGKQNYLCVGCGRQFIDCSQPHKGYSEKLNVNVSNVDQWQGFLSN